MRPYWSRPSGGGAEISFPPGLRFLLNPFPRPLAGFAILGGGQGILLSVTTLGVNLNFVPIRGTPAAFSRASSLSVN